MTAKKRLIRNIIIAVLAIALLGGGYYFALKWEPEPAETTEEAYDPNITYVLFENLDDVSSIEIKNPSGEYSILKDKADDGRSVFSVPTSSYKLDSSAIGSAFGSLIKLSATRTVTEDISKAAEYGLTDDSSMFTVVKTDNSRTTVIIGDEIPTGGEYYCMTEGGDKIYTITSRMAQLALRSCGDYRPTEIMILSASTDISDFTLYHNGELVVKFRETSEEERANAIVPTQWVIEKPWPSEIDAEKVMTLFENFIYISATSFPDEGETPTFDYKLEITAKGKDYSFSIGGESPSNGIYLRDDLTSEVYIVGFPLRNAVMGIDPNVYVTKLVDLEKISDISSLTFKMGNGEYTMSPKNYVICGKEVDEKTFKTLGMHVTCEPQRQTTPSN